MTATTASSRRASAAVSPAGRTAPRVLAIVAGLVVALAANTIVMLTAWAVGVDPAFPAVGPTSVLPATVVGFGVGLAGWSLVRARAAQPARLLRVLVPVVVVLSFAPDIILLTTGFIPGVTVTAAVALMIMHVVIAAVAIPVLARALPVR